MSTFLISDLHFDDDCARTTFNRPFGNTDDMNEYMIKQWNKTVSSSDNVIFVGDVVGTDEFDTHREIRQQIQFRFEQLNGNIVLVPGNHDKIGHPQKATFEIVNSPEFSVSGLDFHCQHRPPATSQELWVIHGHEHTNHNQKYPFIHPDRNTVNVSAELLHYTPISIKSLVELIRTNTRYSFCPLSSFSR